MSNNRYKILYSFNKCSVRKINIFKSPLKRKGCYFNIRRMHFISNTCFNRGLNYAPKPLLIFLQECYGNNKFIKPDFRKEKFTSGTFRFSVIA